MNILRALFLNNSNKENAAMKPTKITTDQSIEFMYKFNLRILSWELRINYHKNQQTASALPLPIQKWLKQQQEQFPRADWVMDRVERSILDEVNDTPAAVVRDIVSRAADQRERQQPAEPAEPAAAPTQAQVPANANSTNSPLQLPSVRVSPVGSSYPLAHNEKNAFHNFDNLAFNKRQILRVFGMEDHTSGSGSGSSFEEGNITPSNDFFDMPRDWDEVIVREEEDDGAPVLQNAAARLIAPLGQTGAPGIAAADDAMIHPQPQGMVVAPTHPQYVAANGHSPAPLINNNGNGNIWQPLHGIPVVQQYTPMVYTPCIQQQQQPQQEPFHGPTGEGFRVTGGHPPQHHQYQHQQGQYAPQYYQPVAVNHVRQETEEQMRKRYEKYYSNHYKRYYNNKLRDYMLQQQQQQQAHYQPQQQQQQQQQQLARDVRPSPASSTASLPNNNGMPPPPNNNTIVNTPQSMPANLPQQHIPGRHTASPSFSPQQAQRGVEVMPGAGGGPHPQQQQQQPPPPSQQPPSTMGPEGMMTSPMVGQQMPMQQQQSMMTAAHRTQQQNAIVNAAMNSVGLGGRDQNSLTHDEKVGGGIQSLSNKRDRALISSFSGPDHSAKSDKKDIHEPALEHDEK